MNFARADNGASSSPAFFRHQALILDISHGVFHPGIKTFFFSESFPP